VPPAPATSPEVRFLPCLQRDDAATADDMAKLTALLAALMLLVLPTYAGARALDVSLDDRVDPVRPGDDLVYEIDLDVTATMPAPGVVITLQLPAGTTFVSAVRQPDYAALAGTVVGSSVEFDLGEEPSCNGKDLPACNAIWATVHVDNGVAPGTVLQATVTATSTDPADFPSDAHLAYTSVGSLAIRKGRLSFSSNPGRDRLQFQADVAREGWSSPNDTLPPTLDFSGGIRVRLGGAGETPVVDVTVPGDAFTCHGLASQSCRLTDPKAWLATGLERLNIFLPFPFLQRNNATVLVQAANLSLPRDIGPDMQLTVDAGGETYSDTALFVVHGSRMTYTHTQAQP
jgi:uncharacterized repeat protein (TIGR01451 family)